MNNSFLTIEQSFLPHLRVGDKRMIFNIQRTLSIIIVCIEIHERCSRMEQSLSCMEPEVFSFLRNPVWPLFNNFHYILWSLSLEQSFDSLRYILYIYYFCRKATIKNHVNRMIVINPVTHDIYYVLRSVSTSCYSVVCFIVIDIIRNLRNFSWTYNFVFKYFIYWTVFWNEIASHSILLWDLNSKKPMLALLLLRQII